jgi:uncharacterized membrane protein YcaP (DUF421 family)
MAIVLTRTIIVYFTLLVAMRLMGKRQLGEMELSEFVVAALIADLAAHPLQDIGIPLINGIVPVLTLFCCEMLISGFSMKSIRFRSLLFGRPSLLIQEGKILQNEMHSNRFTPEELMQELRNQGIYDISRVQYAVLETNGSLNVMPCPEDKPATVGMLGLKIEEESYPSIVINNGRILENNLKWLGFDLNWLEKKLKSEALEKAENIYLMIADRQGRTYIAKKEAINEP